MFPWGSAPEKWLKTTGSIKKLAIFPDSLEIERFSVLSLLLSSYVLPYYMLCLLPVLMFYFEMLRTSK